MKKQELVFSQVYFSISCLKFSLHSFYIFICHTILTWNSNSSGHKISLWWRFKEAPSYNNVYSHLFSPKLKKSTKTLMSSLEFIFLHCTLYKVLLSLLLNVHVVCVLCVPTFFVRANLHPSLKVGGGPKWNSSIWIWKARIFLCLLNQRNEQAKYL